jgi:hypothetical protein
VKISERTKISEVTRIHRGCIGHNTLVINDKILVKPVEITNKMQPCNKIYYSKIYWKLKMFLAAYRLSSGAPNCICSLWFLYPCGDRPLSKLGGNCTVWSSRWWAVCSSKLVEPLINFGIINSITKLHLVGYFYWFILRRTEPWILTF